MKSREPPQPGCRPDAPQPGDQVLEEAGARVFLEETAAETLDEMVLDARVDDNGGVEFSIIAHA